VDFEGLKPIGLSLARLGSTLRVNLGPGFITALFRAPASSSVATPSESAIGNWEIPRQAQLKEK
jgi:hypothetical protein